MENAAADPRPNLSMASAFVLKSRRFWGKPSVVVQSDVLWVNDRLRGWCQVDLGHVSVVNQTTHGGLDCLDFVHRQYVNRQDPCVCSSRVLVPLIGLTGQQRLAFGRVLVAEMQRTRISTEAQEALNLPQIHLTHG
jgi:hypothetical protein